MTKASFVAYIDESGDDGMAKFRDVGKDGATRWFTLSALLVRQTNDLGLVNLRDSIVSHFGRSRRDIHFRQLSHEQKLLACDRIACYPAKAVTVLDYKPGIPEKTKAEFQNNKNRYYWFLTRYLIERISWLCDHSRTDTGKGDGTVKIVFSNRRTLSYEDLTVYLRKLKRKGSSIKWDVIDINNIESRPHASRAGLQIADCVASAFREAVDPNRYGFCEPRYSALLRPIVYRHHTTKMILNYGLKPAFPISRLELTEQRRFIENY